MKQTTLTDHATTSSPNREPWETEEFLDHLTERSREISEVNKRERKPLEHPNGRRWDEPPESWLLRHAPTPADLIILADRFL